MKKKYPISDHYNGKAFFNPGQSGEPSFFDALKMIASLQYSKWPVSIENRPILNLNTSLKSNEVALTFVNHATILIQLPGLNILTDPVWAKRASPVTWAGPKRVRQPGIAFDQLPRIDVVLLSHNHYDHLDLQTLKQLSKKFAPRMFVPLGDKSLLQSAGIERVNEMDWWDAIPINEQTSIVFTPTRHFSSRSPFDRNKTLWGSFLIKSQSRLIYFGGDSAYSRHFKEIHDRFGAVDLALLPIGAYDPRSFMKFFHMNPAEAVQAHLDLNARQSIGIHFGTFQLTEEAIDAPVEDLAAALTAKHVNKNSFVTLPEGVTTLYKLDLEQSLDTGRIG